ncbi:hypothetical protein EDB87DRAFT_348222 [Lactarius vividus]|nr:hypothetical protein EDB87DRAFT_348222 [Lactarius vividus]
MYIPRSTIIQKIDRMRKAGVPTFSSTSGTLRSNIGTQQPSDDALSQCLTEMFSVSGQPVAYIIMDAQISGTLTAREKMLQFLEHLIGLQLANVHICISRSTFGPFLDRWRRSVFRFVKTATKWKISRDTSNHSCTLIGLCEDGQPKIGNWLSIHCQRKQTIQTGLLPVGHLVSMLPRRVDKVKQQFAHRPLQCLAVSVGPVRVEELAEILAVRFYAGAHPQFYTGLRLGDVEEAVLASLITVVNVTEYRIVQFAHFSVKEFLTSNRLATASN